MRLWKEFYRPKSIADALQCLNIFPGPSCLIAGGTDLILDIQQGRHECVESMVDITSIPELNQLNLQQNELFIGAAVPLSQIANSPLVIEHAQALAEACSLIGGPQVRNVATLGGNVAHALPAADGTIALMCLNTQVLVAGQDEFRRVPLQELFLGVGKTELRTNQELIAGFIIPLKRRNQASAFKRVMRMQGIALPILNLSVWVELEGEKFADIHISCGPASSIPLRIIGAEELLRGERISNALKMEVINVLEESIPFRTSPNRATSEYRHHLMKILLDEALFMACNRAGEFGQLK
jgi:CO/xanthine dehydrogenase FAD-binding subunit